MTTEATNLDELRTELYKIFNQAVEDHKNYENGHRSGSSIPFNPTIENRKAISDLARAIAAVEREQREAKERGIMRLDKNKT